MALVLLLFPCVRPAAAARLVTVVRGVGAGSDKAAAQVGYQVRSHFAGDERYEVVDLNKILGNGDRDKALRAFAQAEEFLQKGREAYDTLELDAAVGHLSQVISRYERFAAYVADFKKVAEGLMLLGATHILRGEDKLGQKRLEQALSIFPEIEPDPRIFNPGMRTLFSETAARSKMRAPGSFTLTSTPSSAEVYLDGRFVGVTPLTGEKLPEGRHWVRLEKDGFRAWGRTLEVGTRSEVTDSAQLRATAHFDDFDTLVENCLKRLTAPDNRPANKNDAMDQLGVLTGADHLFLAQVRLDGEKVQIRANQYDVNAQQLLHSGDTSFTYDTRGDAYAQEVGQYLRSQFGGDLTQAARRPLDKKQRAAQAKDDEKAAGSGGLMHAGQARCLGGISCRTSKILTVSITGGIGVGLMAVGGTYWYFAKQDHDDLRKQTQVSPAAARLSQSGKRAALRGDILMGVGGGLTLVSLGLLTWWDPTPSDAAFVGEGNSRSAPAAALQLLPLPGGGLLQARLPF